MPVSISRPTALPASVAPPSTENIIINQPGRFTIDLSNILFDQMAEGAKKKIAIAGKREIVGASDLVFCETSQKTDGTVSANDQLTETIDSTTYPDRVIISGKNERGYNVYLTRMALHGKPITIARGSSGSLLLDSLKRDDDIRRNGENVKVISNDYIFDAVQVPTIADYWYKKCGAKKHLYSLQVHGSALWYEPGDWYTLSLGGAGTNEYISATVEIVSVSVQRTAGGIGVTSLLVRECMESWSKTTLYTARLVTGASPKRRTNQSNTLIVASSSFDGTYDYRCDGTADDVQIQAAIDYLSATFGGGTVQRTAGVYTYANKITMKDNVCVIGMGGGTIDCPASTSITTMYDWGTTIGAILSDCAIDGNKSSLTFTADNMKVLDGKGVGVTQNVTVQNYVFSDTVGLKTFSAFYSLDCLSCYAIGNTCGSSGANITYFCMFSYCYTLTRCQAKTNTSTGNMCIIEAFWYCQNLSGCISKSNASSGYAATINSFGFCTNLASCESSGNITSGVSAIIHSFVYCTNGAACISSGNTTSGAGSYIESFRNCIRFTVSNSIGNVSTLAAEYGFHECNSLQQCNSSGDSNPYTTSYADAGTSNTCADNANGGFNS
jgi:hypothetical protein